MSNIIIPIKESTLDYIENSKLIKDRFEDGFKNHPIELGYREDDGEIITIYLKVYLPENDPRIPYLSEFCKNHPDDVTMYSVGTILFKNASNGVSSFKSFISMLFPWKMYTSESGSNEVYVEWDNHEIVKKYCNNSYKSLNVQTINEMILFIKKNINI